MVYSQKNNWILLWFKCYYNDVLLSTNRIKMNTYCTSIDNMFTNIHILIISSKTGQSWQSKVWPFGPPSRKHKPHKRTTICCSKGVQALNGPEQSHTHEHKIYAPNHLKHQIVQNIHKIHDRKLAGPKYWKQPNAAEHSKVITSMRSRWLSTWKYSTRS